jgi:hypothetical protein
LELDLDRGDGAESYLGLLGFLISGGVTQRSRKRLKRGEHDEPSWLGLLQYSEEVEMGSAGKAK